MRILICNDDGFGSVGLEALTSAAGSLSKDLWVVAPDGKRTAGSHALTLGTSLQLVDMMCSATVVPERPPTPSRSR